MSERRPGRTVRTRILTATLCVVALALIAIIFVTGRTLFARVESTAALELTHEAAKLRAYAESADARAADGSPDTRALLTDYLSQHVAETHETLFSIVDGVPDRRSRAEPLVRLDRSTDFIAEVGGVTEPMFDRVPTPAGPAMYAALPVQVSGDDARGVLVVVQFLGPEQADAWSTVFTMAAAGCFALLLAASAGWLVAGRALTPIRKMRETAAEIDGGDLHRRIDVSGTDDVAQLAVTFNRMLDRLQSAFDGQRRFLDDAGHELRTPITVVRGHLELMGDDPVDREQTLRLVDDELRRMSRLVDDLILLARSERPDFLITAPTDAADLVVETLAKATALATRAWALDAVPEGEVLVDEQRLAQCLLQLAANAVQHTVEGDVIAIGGTSDHERLRLWVRDEGYGIPFAEQPHIFDRFHRGAGTRHAGSGLGLAIVARIVEAHGGRVSVSSTPGHGARFLIDIPHAREEPR
ncbi:ATP-binding protein [Microbacterium sp.]|uniref:sensor histidine kinase n=1 Tax=Microbacterium sp. TaxID=51671 RepID=UPI0028A82FA1|nr:ATP-binding protein [Microbacterium sp.]